MLGGMSWESTAEYYRLANEIVRDRVGGLSSARILLHSVDFAQVERMQATGDWEAAGRLLAEAARGLERGGAELLVLCTNTMHKVADAINKNWAEPQAPAKADSAQPAVSAAYDRLDAVISELDMTLDFTQSRLQSILRPAGPNQADKLGDRAGGVEMAMAIHMQADRLFNLVVRMRDFNDRIEL